MNCISCKEGFYKLNGTNNCYNRTLLNGSYYLKEDMLFHCDENCLTCSKDKNNLSNNCLSCDINKGLYLVEKLNNCEYSNYSGYYLDTNHNIPILKQCYNSCKTCNRYFEYNISTNVGNHNCIECKEGYYFKYETINCYDNKTIEESYYLDKGKTPYIWKKCYERCKTCDKYGDFHDMHCLSCKTNLIKEKELIPLRLKLTNNGNCIEGCENNLLLTLDGNCSSICPNNTFEFSLNNTCLKYCPKGYEINQDQNKCIQKSIEKTTSSEFKTQIMSNISDFICSTNSSKVINGSDFVAVIIPSDKMDPKDQLKKGISAIDLGNCTNVMKEYYKISKDENLYVLNIESKRNETKKSEEKNDNSFNLGKNIEIEIYDKLGRKLDLSICNQDIKVMKYIGDVGELDIHSAKNLASQGIDVFNANDGFFNDICHEFKNTNGKDIILKDRRADIYKNATFCKKGCLYTGMNYELMTANCICDSSLLQSSSNNNETNKENEINEEDNNTFKALTKSFISNLFDFNFDVFKCYNLVFNIKIIYNNIGFYCMSAMLVLQIICLFIVLIRGLYPLKIFMLIFNSYNPKISFPPKNNNNNSNINALNNNKENKIIEIDNKKIKFRIKKMREKKQVNLNDDNKYIKSNNKTKYIKKCSNNFIKNKRIKIPHLEEIEEEKYDNNINKIIVANNFSPTINFKNFIFNKNKVKQLLHINKKDAKFKKKNKEIFLELSKDKSKLYTIKSHKKLFFHNRKKLNLNNMETIEEKNKNKIMQINNKDLIILSKSDDNLQDMSYEQAILYDKRTYLRIYWAFLVDKQIILLTFCKKNYFNLFAIKLSFLVCTFQISFFLNAFFYTDEYISNAYHNDGVLDFFSGLPKSIYSLLATMLITNLLTILSNSKSELVNLIRQKRNNKNYIYIVNIKLKKIRNKLIMYFILAFLLGTLFLYYVCSFCSVYRYSQKYWFIGCLESFCMDFLVAVIVCIFLALFRYIAIKRHLKCLYAIANIISNFL